MSRFVRVGVIARELGVHPDTVKRRRQTPQNPMGILKEGVHYIKGHHRTSPDLYDLQAVMTAFGVRGIGPRSGR